MCISFFVGVGFSFVGGWVEGIGVKLECGGGLVLGIVFFLFSFYL